AFDRRSVGREWMRTSCLAESPHQRALRRLEEDQDRVQVADQLEAAIDRGKLGEQLSFAHVYHYRCSRDLAAGAKRQLREHRQQRHGQVVDTEVSKILERTNCLRLARSGNPGQDDEPRSHGGPCCTARGVPLLAHYRSSPCSTSGSESSSLSFNC